MKILHTADWHYGSPFASFSPEDREYLRRESRRLPESIARLCRREGCDLVLLAGDVFDSNDADPTPVMDSLESCGVPVMISPGNHDFWCADAPWQKKWPENVHIFEGPLSCVTIDSLGLNVYGAGYRSMDCPALLDGFRSGGLPSVAVLHGDPTRDSSPYSPITAAQVRQSGLRYLALGHIHKAGSFTAGETLCAWPGCPMGRGWDETGEKGVYLVELGEETALSFLPLDTPRFVAREVSAGDAPMDALRAVLPPARREDFYRITLTGLCDLDLPELKRALGDFPHLELIDKTRSPGELWAQAGEDTLRGVYFQLLREASQRSETADAAVLAADISLALLEGREVTLP